MLKNSVVVLKRSELGYTAYANFIPYELVEEDTGMIVRTVILTRKDVDDLGWPDEITVTIQPDDQIGPRLE